MRIYFSSTHIKTLMKLQELAQKHDCAIDFGVDVVDESDSFDWDVIAEKYDMPNKVKNDIENNLYLTTSGINGYHYWFELRDNRNKDKTIYNTLTYTNLIMFAEYSYFDSLSGKSVEWLDENGFDGYIGDSNEKTTIKGFKGVDTSDIEVYREGMTLKFFGDLVCDYLGEERIIEVY